MAQGKYMFKGRPYVKVTMEEGKTCTFMNARFIPIDHAISNNLVFDVIVMNISLQNLFIILTISNSRIDVSYKLQFK